MHGEQQQQQHAVESDTAKTATPLWVSVQKATQCAAKQNKTLVFPASRLSNQNSTA